jgi:hypothetical protein
MTNKSINLSTWINENTKNSKSVVELGAGFFNRLSNVHYTTPIKIGIEIWQPYIDNAKYHNCIKIQGDVKDYKLLLKGYELDTVMIIDVLEHFDKETAFKLIENLKEDFNKILLMLPVGDYIQDKDVTGYGAHIYQTHRSYWYEKDIKTLNFTNNIIDELFHDDGKRKEMDLPTSCYFGVYEKNKTNINV